MRPVGQQALLDLVEDLQRHALGIVRGPGI
jgi:hypothetical protein